MKGTKKRKSSVSNDAINAVVKSKLVLLIVLVIAAVMMAYTQPPTAHPVIFWIGVLSPVIFLSLFFKKLVFETFVVIHIIESLLGWFDWYNAVDDNLLLGAIPLMDKHVDELQRLNIALVISVVEPFELETPVLLGEVVSPSIWKKVGIEQRVLSCPDFFPPPMQILDEGAAILDKYLSEGKRVYIHCKSGKGRSASVVLAYFAKYRYTGLDLVGAYKKLLTRRSVIFREHSPQMRQIDAFLKRCRGNM